MHSRKMRDNRHKLKHKMFWLDIRKSLLPWGPSSARKIYLERLCSFYSWRFSRPYWKNALEQSVWPFFWACFEQEVGKEIYICTCPDATFFSNHLEYLHKHFMTVLLLQFETAVVSLRTWFCYPKFCSQYTCPIGTESWNLHESLLNNEFCRIRCLAMFCKESTFLT